MLSLKGAVRTRRIRSVALKLVVLCALTAADLGFAGFIWLLPSRQVALDGNADGIVVLTGGTSRVSDALELLASGRGKRLLITGVNPDTTTGDIAREVVSYNKLLACCVDLDYSALNTYGNAVQARRWAMAHGFHSLIVVTSAYHMPRALAELCTSVAGRHADSVPGRVRPAACRAVVVERRHHQAGAVGISQIPCRQSAHAARFLRHQRIGDIHNPPSVKTPPSLTGFP